MRARSLPAVDDSVAKGALGKPAARKPDGGKALP